MAEALVKKSGSKNLLIPPKECKVLTRRRSTLPDLHPDINAILQPLQLTPEDYIEIMDRMTKSFVKGLSKEHHMTSHVKMYTSYIRSIPDGTETGNYMALDFGGTNIRIFLASIQNHQINVVENRWKVIPTKLLTGSGQDLFDYLAQCIYDVLDIKGLTKENVKLGFTFSFPCRFKALNEAYLYKWTKNFACTGVEGENVVALLQEALNRRGDLNVECLAIVNDTVGTLIACAWEYPNCAIGLILGTGTNAAYIETLENCEFWDIKDDGPQEVLIDTEWEYFGDEGELDFICTPHDKTVDAASSLPGVGIYEKLISGLYLGEIARLFILELVEEKKLFDGQTSEELQTKGRFFTKYISEVESDITSPYEATRSVLNELNITDITEEDCHIVKEVCMLVSKRAAYLAAVGIAALLNKMKRPDVTVGIDGSLFQCHPKFSAFMHQKLEELVQPGIEYQLCQTEDGSGMGAALVAAVADRIREQSQKKDT